MQYEDGGAQIRLFNPAKPILGGAFLVLPVGEVFGPARMKSSRDAPRRALGSWCWKSPGNSRNGRLVDFKSSSLRSQGRLLCDVIDNDSGG
jgi:hypothetical protein